MVTTSSAVRDGDGRLVGREGDGEESEESEEEGEGVKRCCRDEVRGNMKALESVSWREKRRRRRWWRRRKEGGLRVVIVAECGGVIV